VNTQIIAILLLFISLALRKTGYCNDGDVIAISDDGCFPTMISKSMVKPELHCICIGQCFENAVVVLFETIRTEGVTRYLLIKIVWFHKTLETLKAAQAQHSTPLARQVSGIHFLSLSQSVGQTPRHGGRWKQH
jgi:hypothetical protein